MNIINLVRKPSASVTATVALALVSLFQIPAAEARYAPETLDNARLVVKAPTQTGKTLATTERQLLQSVQDRQNLTQPMNGDARLLVRPNKRNQSDDSYNYLSHR